MVGEDRPTTPPGPASSDTVPSRGAPDDGAPRPAPAEGGEDFDALAAGTPVGKYEIVEVLGQGGFGITYRARDSRLGRDVAVKEYLPTSFARRHGATTVLPRSTRTAEDFLWGRERFLDEAKTLARLENTAGIVNVYDYLEANGTAYMVMALVRGETLEARLKGGRRLPQPTIEQFFYPLLDGLETVHRAGFLHRDIKPANILLDADGRPTLIDFGASRLALQGRTRAMTAVYTPGYAAFEQATSGPQGPWTDIYALAATLYQCVTGSLPPGALDRMAKDTLVPASDAGHARYAPSLLAAIDAGLKLRAEERPQSIEDWRRTMAGLPLTAPTDALTRR
ncbi:MAG: serine/threonine protein kinase, partial [Alphaproteobacteria bacterium]|nr:serine/threonine protein kinase [Alphaproteobacteria bacterium]